jgi:hypothetical protein
MVSSGLSHLILSINGITPEVYESYRRGGNLSLVVSSVRKLVKERHRQRRQNPIIELQFIPNGFSSESLLECQREAYRRFYLRPTIFGRHPKMIRPITDLRRYARLWHAALGVFLKSKLKK